MYYVGMEDLKKLFGKRIRELRIKKGYSQEQLAEIIDIAERNISKIECGENFPRADKISKIAAALDVVPQELFNFEHLQKGENLLEEITFILKKNPEKITDVYKVVRALTS